MTDAAKFSNAGIEHALRTMPKFGTGVGLHRMIALCAPLAGWMNELNAIKVTGSNGKGSVSAMVASMLTQLGFSTGLYTSPHLVKFNERVSVDGQPISDTDLAEAVQWMNARIGEYNDQFPDEVVGAFEGFTALALRYFSRRGPQAIVAEAGIGGRYDSTRVISGNVVGLTSLDLEHTDLLGKSLEMIAYDKADLCPAGGTIVTGVSDPQLIRRLRTYCALRNVTLRCVGEFSEIKRVSFGTTHMELDLLMDGISLPHLRVKLQGYHQITNVTIAISLLTEWLHRQHVKPPQKDFEQAIRAGLASVHWPGRFERIHENPDFYIDVGHSPSAIDALVTTVRAALTGKRILLVTGVSYDKEVESIVRGLINVADAVICTRAHHKGSPPKEILRIVRNARPNITSFVDATISEAVRHALDYATENNMTILVAGGLFLSIEAQHALRGYDPETLHFF